ncbi:MAG TPA: selenoneine biosynthesis selenosugar synthase SenB [Burkholderiales bacterium]|nr:selenoneine biosynthesis selenosugar synthase SenB [Burkholderiales bacterium]
MRRIAIVTPARPGTRTGNLHTAQRWAAMLRSGGGRVSVTTGWDGGPADGMIALHARRSHASVLRFRARRPSGGLVIALTGTDLYRDLPRSAEARLSLAHADRIVVLQDEAKRALAPALRRKTRVVYQSSDTRLRHAPPARVFRVAVAGHLREEKDPFRAVRALAHLRRENVEVVHIGKALSPQMRREARRWMRREPRYRWLGSVPHHAALGWIAASHVLVVSSRMEGGANVISEAVRIGTPVLASRIAGNVGMLGRGYRGYYAPGNARALARLIGRCVAESGFHSLLRSQARRRRPLFSPAAERRALRAVVAEAAAPRR